MKKYFITVLSIATLSSQLAAANCQKQATVAHSEFFVCTQYDQPDKCFFDYVVTNKPQVQCQEWLDVCLETSQAADMDSALCK